MPYQTKQRKRDGVLERKCRCCAEWLWIEEFVKASNCEGGYRPVCRACRQEQRRQRRAANPEPIRAAEKLRKKRFYWANPERARRLGRICRAKYAVKDRARGLPLHNERDQYGRWRKSVAA